MQGRILGLRALALLAFLSSSAGAEVWVWSNILLDGSQQVPSVDTPATGVATATLDTATGVLRVDGVFEGLRGLSNDAHVHWPALRGEGGAGTLFDLVFDEGVSAGRFSGVSDPLPPDVVADVLAGRVFVNVHSTFAEGGEIRGQLEGARLVPEPAAALLIALATTWATRRPRP